VLVVRKVGHPWHREFAVGALALLGWYERRRWRPEPAQRTSERFLPPQPEQLLILAEKKCG
jgi:predicted phosphoribosyltransferase